ncbi:MAG: hypothetical protein ACFB9M_13205 [Myxococcota bacterium]
MGEDPLADDILQRAFFQSPRPSQAQHPSSPAPVRQTHYKVLSISLYVEDIRKLDAMVAELKQRGNRKANRSQLIRFALGRIDLDDFPPEI